MLDCVCEVSQKTAIQMQGYARCVECLNSLFMLLVVRFVMCLTVRACTSSFPSFFLYVLFLERNVLFLERDVLFLERDILICNLVRSPP